MKRTRTYSVWTYVNVTLQNHTRRILTRVERWLAWPGGEEVCVGVGGIKSDSYMSSTFIAFPMYIFIHLIITKQLHALVHCDAVYKETSPC